MCEPVELLGQVNKVNASVNLASVGLLRFISVVGVPLQLQMRA